MATFPSSAVAFGSAGLHKTNNLGQTTLNGGIASGATSLVLTSATALTTWPTATFCILNATKNELAFCTSRTGTTCTITKGFGSTTSVAWDNGDSLRVVLASEAIQVAFEEIIAIESYLLAGGAGLNAADNEVITGLWDFSHANGLKTGKIQERSADGGIILDFARQGFLFRNIAADTALAIQSQSAGVSSIVALSAKDGDGTDTVGHVVYGLGTPTANTNIERLFMQYTPSGPRFDIFTNASGTGTLRPLHLYTGSETNQFALGIDGGITFGMGSQQYKWLDRSNTLTLQGQTSATSSRFEFYAKDGDGTDDVTFGIFGLGTPSNITNFEEFIVGYNAGGLRYEIYNSVAGTGVRRPIHLYASGTNTQMVLETTGNVAFDTNVLYVDSVNNRVGILNTTPTTALDVTGSVTATAFFGNGAGLTGIASGTGGVINTGSTTIGADSDSDGVGVIALQTRGTTRVTISNTGITTFSKDVNLNTGATAPRFYLVVPEVTGNYADITYTTVENSPTGTAVLAHIRTQITDADPNPLKSDLYFYVNAGDSILEALRITSGRNVMLGAGGSFGASAFRVLGIANGTAPTTSPADMVQLWSDDFSASNAQLNIRAENTSTFSFGAGEGVFTGTSVLTDAANKNFRVGVRHYMNTEEAVGAFFVQSLVSSSLLNLGGGTSLFNAVTQIDFYTAANNTTVTGTRRATIDSSGNFGLATTTFGTSAAGVFALGAGTAPTTGVANVVQMWVADDPIGGVGDAALWFKTENAVEYVFGSLSSTNGILTFQPNNTDATNKGQDVVLRHYSLAQGYFRPLAFKSDSTDLLVTVGGGSGSYKAATITRFYAAANNTTTTGTLIASIGVSGLTIGPALAYAGQFGTSAAGVISIQNGTAPSTSPGDVVQMWSADIAAGQASLHVRDELGAIYQFGAETSGRPIISGITPEVANNSFSVTGKTVVGSVGSTTAIGRIEMVITQANPSTLKGDIRLLANMGDSLTELLRVADSGHVVYKTLSSTSPTTDHLANTDFAMSRNGNTGIRFALRGSDGTIRTAEIVVS